MERDECRKTVVEYARKLLLGPLAEDEVLRSNPSDNYLTGILWPRGESVPLEEDDAGSAEVADDGPEGVEMPVPGYRSVRPCSLGLTCTINATAEIRIDLAETARYRPFAVSDQPETKCEGAETENENADEVGEDAENAGGYVEYEWRREKLGYQIVIPSSAEARAWRTHEFILPDGSTISDPDIAVDIKIRAAGSSIVLTVTLINMTPQPEGPGPRDYANLFQAGITVMALTPEGRGAVSPRESKPMADDEDSRTNMLLYRDTCEFAVGHGISAVWEPDEGTHSVSWVATSWMPETAVTGTSPEGHATLRGFSHRGINPFSAGILSSSKREDVCDALEAFSNLYAAWIRDSLEAKLSSFEGEMHVAAAANLERCNNTMDRMRRGTETLRSSDLAWNAFTLANKAMDQQSRLPSRGDRAGPLFWRPFQLAFLLLVLPSVVSGNDPDRDTMDLLWFPTGGGKTEAYLALTAFQIFFRRLSNSGRRESGGVDVIMRYTLRLLTVQQFQRAAALISTCDLIRAADEERLGTARISLGLYVGDESTPNHLEKAVEKLTDELAGMQPRSTPRQLLRCPLCGGDLPVRSYQANLNARTLDIVCPEVTCPSAGQSLPVMTVDDLIYDQPPSLLIGTIDKFAQLPRSTSIRKLFGLGSDTPPGLIIQDELHLISGPLGSVSGLYESAIDLLCTADGVRPKIIGSTATIGRASRQVRALFDRNVLQFPPPGFDASDSFFAVKDTNVADRLYVGISTAGRSPKFSLQAVVAAALQAAFFLRESGAADDQVIDPYWTCVAYFNSLRELGGAHVLMQDDVPRQMRFLAGRLGCEPRPVEAPPRELSSRVSSRQIPMELLELERCLSTDPLEPEPAHAVLASNMISVGVDIARLGLMVVNGQPKSTAEYIQATSRVGRGLPGLVFTIYNFGRPRDVSHYEHFCSYHSALYRGVEATSVTPWAPRARDKALHAVFVSLVRHLIPGMVEDDDAISFDSRDPEVRKIADYLVHRCRVGSGGLEDTDAGNDLSQVIRAWGRRAADSQAAGKPLRYWLRKPRFNRTPAPHLMFSAEEMKEPSSASWPTPNSMRDVEPSTAFVLID